MTADAHPGQCHWRYRMDTGKSLGEPCIVTVSCGRLAPGDWRGPGWDDFRNIPPAHFENLPAVVATLDPHVIAAKKMKGS